MTLEQILRLTQQKLKKELLRELQLAGFKTQTKKGFLYAQGALPVLLVAHLDTVHRTPVQTICYSKDGQTIMSPEGIGGDDRAGVYAILQIIKKHKCHVLFCEDEEIGGIGANLFCRSDIRPNVNFIIEIDRRGSNDAVFYDCANPEFTKFVTSFGFEEAYGSFSDISHIAPHLGIAAVNISAGYMDEHTRHEHIDLRIVKRNADRIKAMCEAKTPRYEYIESPVYRWKKGLSSYYEDTYDFSKYRRREEPYLVELMEIDEPNYIINAEGEMETGYKEGHEQYLLDKKGNVYEYLYDIDMVVRADYCKAFGPQGLPAKFVEDKALYYDVVSEEFALAAQDELYERGPI